MFLNTGYLSSVSGGRTLLLAAAAFAAGLATGVGMGPLTAERVAAFATPPAGDVEVTSSIPSLGRGGYPAEVLGVTDGDTFQAQVSVWPGIAITTLVRLRGIDTPELKARCADERMKAEAARAALGKILAEGGVEISRVSLDKFGGRVDADISTRLTPDVSAALLRAGLARNYNGGRRESWCS